MNNFGLLDGLLSLMSYFIIIMDQQMLVHFLIKNVLQQHSLYYSLCEKCPNVEFFLVRIFPYSDWIRRNTEYLSVFSPNVGKYGRENSVFGHFSRSDFHIEHQWISSLEYLFLTRFLSFLNLEHWIACHLLANLFPSFWLFLVLFRMLWFLVTVNKPCR